MILQISHALESDLLKIEPSFALPEEIASPYLETIQQILKFLIPLTLFEEPMEKSAFFFRLNRLLPIIHYPKGFDHPQIFPIAFLCPSEYTHGVGRYIADTLTRWLIPGKQLPIIGRVSLNFRFAAYPTTSFYLSQEMIFLSTLQDLQTAKENLPALIKEMKINIMAVYHARYITSLKSTSHQHRSMLLQANLSSLLNPSNEWDKSLFDQFQGILTKFHAEEKFDQVKKNISHLLSTRPKMFDREVFYEIAQYSHLFKESFSSTRNPHHISRIIAYQYLFKKVIQEKVRKSPMERHFSFKLLRGPLLENINSLGILFGFNFLAETERFEFRHLHEGLRTCLPSLETIPDSLIIDRRHEKARFFYVEVIKKGERPFTSEEIKHLKEKLPQELIQQIETPVHPIFLPRNEEEVMRNLILLSKQIKYVRDLPQVSIHYDMQSETHLTFTVILVRLLKPTSLPIAQLMQSISQVKVEIDDIRTAGFLKKKYPKEAATLRITLDKTPFFRADYSIDLLRARQKVVGELTKALGEFRDFNGGIILKQEESFTHLRNAFPPISPEIELLLENYFYSLRPGIMQTVHDTATLKEHFSLFQSLLTSDPKETSYEIKATLKEKYFLIFIKGLAPSFKEPLFDAVAPISSRDLTTASLETNQATFVGFILKTEKRQQATHFQKKVAQTMQRWEKNFLCSVQSI